MKKLLIPLCAAAVFVAGCRVVEVENRGEEVARDAEGKPITLADGKIQTIKKGWSVYHNQHWMATKADSLTALVEKDKINFALNALNTEPSEKLGELVEKSLTGVTTLAEKVGAAVATSGGSVAADAVSAAIARFIGKGGKVGSASVACEGGNCTISDGSVSECLNCEIGK